MEIKKNQLISAVVLCSMFAAPTLFCACDKDEDTTNNEPKDPVPAMAQFDYVIETSQDMLEFCDITLKYNDGTGEKSAQLTQIKDTVTIKAGLPATFSVKLEATVKNGTAFEEGSHVSVTRNISYVYTLLTADEEPIQGKFGTYSNNYFMAVGGDRFGEYIGNGRFNRETTLRLDASGQQVTEIE